MSRSRQDNESSPEHIWSLFNPVEAEAIVNALRRWQSSFSLNRHLPGVVLVDPYVRLTLNRCMPASVEKRLCQEPLDALLNDVIAVRTAVMDEQLLNYALGDGITQLIIVASGMDTRAWRLKWPAGMKVFEIDSATIQGQKFAALGDIQPNCHRVSLVGDVYCLADVLQRMPLVGFDRAAPTMWLVEDVVEYMLPEHASQMFEVMAVASAPGSRLVASLSNVKLRHLIKRFASVDGAAGSFGGGPGGSMSGGGALGGIVNVWGHNGGRRNPESMHMSPSDAASTTPVSLHQLHHHEEYEPPGIVLNRITAAGWSAEMLLSGQLDHRFDINLHNCLYIVLGVKP